MSRKYREKCKAAAQEMGDFIDYCLHEEGVYATIYQAGDQARVIMAVAFGAARMRIHEILPNEDIQHGEQRLSELLRYAWDSKEPEPEAVFIANALSKDHELAIALITRFAGEETPLEIATDMAREEQSKSLKLSPHQWRKFLDRLDGPSMDAGKEAARYSSPPRGR